MWQQSLAHLLALTICLSLANSQDNATIVSIPGRDTYLLPPTFISNYSNAFVDTSLPASSPDRSLFTGAHNASFISYTQEFTSLIGPSPTKRLIAGPSDAEFAYELGVYVPEHNLVWFTGTALNDTGRGPGISRIVHAINLTDDVVYTPNLTEPLIAANGGSYFDGKVYVCHWGNYTYAGGILAIDPLTGETETVVNSYFGVRLNGPDDLIWALPSNKSNSSDAVMFFTDVDFSAILNFTGPAQLPNAIWRFSPKKQSLQPVIPRSDITSPNGLAVSPDFKSLYVSDTPVSNLQGRGPGNTTGSAAVFVYDLDENLAPVNKRLFAIARTGVPDGMKVDRKGRLWTGEGEGIVVRDATGKVLGVFNAKTLLDQAATPIANFALARDSLIVLAVDQIWEIKLAEVVSWEE